MAAGWQADPAAHAGLGSPCAQAGRQIPLLSPSHTAARPATHRAATQDVTWPAPASSLHQLTVPSCCPVLLSAARVDPAHAARCYMGSLPFPMGWSGGRDTPRTAAAGAPVWRHSTELWTPVHEAAVAKPVHQQQHEQGCAAQPVCHHTAMGWVFPAQPCFWDSSPTTMSPHSEATTASPTGAFSHSPAPPAHTGWGRPPDTTNWRRAGPGTPLLQWVTPGGCTPCLGVGWESPPVPLQAAGGHRQELLHCSDFRV